jgi:hypothetical protein
MNLSDTFYLAMIMTILILGVVYWFWTQNQYLQRKIQTLENVMYEIKTSLSSGELGGGLSAPAPAAQESDLAPAMYPPAPSSVLDDDDELLHAELLESSEHAHELHEDVEELSIDDAIAQFNAEEPAAAQVDEDLQPGGVGSGIKEVVVPDSAAKGSVLDTMTIQELKRLAEQRGISGASKMRKQALIDAIRAAPTPSPFTATDGVLELN